MSKLKIIFTIVLGIFALSGSNKHHFSEINSEEVMMDPIEYVICDDDGFSELNILDIQTDVLSSYDGTTTVEAVVISTSTGAVIQLNDLSGTITTELICDFSNSLSDIAVDENSVIYATDFNSIFAIDQTDCTTTYPPNIGSIPSTNSLSFDTQGNMYFGGANNSSVYRYDSDELSAPYIWHDFGSGSPSGDFVVLNGKMYISWSISSNVELYEVTIDDNFNYVSHINLGTIINGTFGLASELGNLYGVATGELYKIDLDTFTFTTVETNNFTYGSWYGAAGLHEAVNYEVSSYDTATDANGGVNPLPDLWTNTQQGGQTIYVRVEDTLTGTFEIIEVNIIIYDNLPDLVMPSNLSICEDQTNTVFDLTTVETELLQNVSHAVTTSYHISDIDATMNVSPLGTNYTLTTNQETIYVRVQNVDNECFSISQFDVLISPSPEIVIPSDLFQCEDEGNGIFDLTTIETELLQNNTNPATVTYHNSMNDATMDVSPINTNYQIAASGQETIFVRIESNGTNCFTTTQFDINLGASLQISTPTDIIQCQGENNDIFELTQVEMELLTNTSQAVTVTYHTSLNDANANTSPINTNYAPSASQETIYVRVDNDANDCFAVTQFDVIINEGIGITIPGNLVQCQGENNGVFDLTQTEDEILQNVTQTVTINYYSSLADAATGTDAIDPNYFLTTNQATIYIRVEDPSNGCFETTQITIQVIENPEVAQIANSPTARLLTDCYLDENTTGYFNLNDIYSEVVLDGNANYSLVFYLTEDDADQDINTIDPIYYANNDVEEIYVAVVNDTGCRSISNFFVDPDCYDDIVDISNIYFPGFFTPNNDLTNDTWNVRGISQAVQQSAIMYIFDRYGKLLYYFRPGQTEGWDGTYRGKTVPSSDYWYKFQTSEGQVFSGSFSLIR